MGSGIPSSRSARQGLITSILQTHTIGSQNELRNHLSQAGVEVTQATLSRDLDELGAVKIRIDGTMAYRIADQSVDSGDRLTRWIREILLSADTALNQIVLKTPPGAAQLLAAGMDRTNLDGLLGCIAGDDTVLLVMNSVERAQIVTQKLLNLGDKSEESI